MKPVDFGYARPATIAEAVALLASNPDAKIIAGGQTLGPMLNLRLARPSLLVDVARIPELTRVDETADLVTLGAAITHAAIEDGRVPDFTNGFLARVAQGIAYRAVRNRGTVGGSLAHADPAADWLTAFVALDAEVVIAGPRGTRTAPLVETVTGAMATSIDAAEILTGVRFRKLSRKAGWSYHKICRKTGEFAEAIGTFVEDDTRGVHRAVAGATGGKPIVMTDWHRESSAEDWCAFLRSEGYRADPYEMRIHGAALARAVVEIGQQ